MKTRQRWLNLLWAGLLGTMLLGAPITASAQQPPDHDTTRPELRSFDQFLDNHPQVAKDLRHNPKLVNNPDFVRDHPALRDYLEDHPKVREEVKENPRAFMGRERKFEKHEKVEQPRDRK